MTAKAVAGFGLLGAVVALLHHVGGPLAPPPFHDIEALGGWLDQREAAEVAFAAVRLVALGLGWYLLLLTTAAALARILRARRLMRAVEVAALPPVRRLLDAAVGLSLVTTLSSPALALEPRSPATVPVASETSLPSMRLLPDPVPPAPAVQAPEPPPEPPAPLAPPAKEWTVRPGEHFWAVAEEVLADAWRRRPSEAEVVPYWRSLVSANQGRLADPDNPDLLFPGQVLVLPPPPAHP